MFTSINRTIFDIPLTWNRTRFEASRHKCRQARKLIETSINAQYNKQLKDVFFQKLEIEKNINESQQCLINNEKKVQALDTLINVATESLTDYFDKRMENVRIAIEEHCNAIQQILREENEHWQEIHTVIDRNIITFDDIHRCQQNTENEVPINHIHTIDEADEDEHPSKLLNNKTVTPLLTQMIRKSRLQSNRSSTTEHLIPNKQEQISVVVPPMSARSKLCVNDTTFVIKLEQTDNTEPNCFDIVPIQSVATIEIEATPSYSQPKPPGRLYFSPTLLQEDEPLEPIQHVLSTIDQNQSEHSSIVTEKSKMESYRVGQTFLLDNVKTEENNRSENVENIPPQIFEDIPIEIDQQNFNQSDDQQPIVYSKRPTRAAAIKVKTEPVQTTRRTTKRQTRKRKQSASDDGNENTISLRKRKTLHSPVKTTRKTRAKKTKEIPIREPSPLPIIDRSKHYSTRFSTRSHRLNNLTLSATSIADDNDITHHNKTKNSSIHHRNRSTAKIQSRENNENDRTMTKAHSKTNKKKPKKRTDSMVSTRVRRKKNA